MSPSARLDDRSLERLFTATVRFAPTGGGDPEQWVFGLPGEESAGQWQATFEGHLVSVLERFLGEDGSPGEDVSVFEVFVDGEPSGHLESWPSNWLREG